MSSNYASFGREGEYHNVNAKACSLEAQKFQLEVLLGLLVVGRWFGLQKEAQEAVHMSKCLRAG